MSQRDPYKLRPAFHGMRDREPLKPRAAARRVPVPSLDDYSWPTPEELSFFDDDEAAAYWADHADNLIFGALEEDDFDCCSCRSCCGALPLPHLDAFEEAYEDRW
jgi:hypothetical protein